MEPIRPERFVVVAISIVLVLYAGSLLAPVATVLTTNNNKSEIWSGWQVLGIGWLGLVFRNFAWLANALAEFPDRGSRPRELAALGLTQYKQLIQPPWRVIYSMEDGDIVIHLIADSRRDMGSLLQQRLLSG